MPLLLCPYNSAYPICHKYVTKQSLFLLYKWKKIFIWKLNS
jgi:hypothetical protein